jgi:hypothetical protein
MEPEKVQWALSAPPREAHTTQCEPITKIASLHSLIRTPCSPSHSRHAPPPGTAPASPVLLCSAHCPHLDPTRPGRPLPRSTTPRCARRRGARRRRPPTGRPRARPRRRPPPSPGTPAHRHHHASPGRDPGFCCL